jgi:glycerol 3-phosphatase-2
VSDTLLNTYDAVLLDLDGTVYRGGSALPGAEEAVSAARTSGVAVRFVTNNASRSPQDVATHLCGLGVSAEVAEVSTSAQAAGTVLARQLPAGAEVLVFGTDALAEVVSAVDLRPVRKFTETVAGVVQGLNQDAGWRDLAEACLSIRAGALWVACNVDATLPTERGELPGNGAMVAALRAATGREPIVAGKPARPLLDEAVRAAGAHRPLFVGDRLDTDIAGADAVGMDSLFVLTGVSSAADVLVGPQRLRPTYIAANLSAIHGTVDELVIGPQSEWAVRRHGRTLSARHTVKGTDVTEVDEIALLRALCDAYANPDGGPVEVLPDDDVTRSALKGLGLLGADQR